MANNCIQNEKYSKEDYGSIKLAIRLGKDVKALLESMYGEGSSMVDTILEAITNGEFNENWDVDSPVSNVSPETTPVLINGAQKEESPEVSLLNDYYYNRENGYAEIHEAETKFVDDVLSRVLYDKHSKAYQNPNTENVNKALYNYKIQLLNALWEATGISHEEELDPNSDESLNKVINKTILDFGNIAVTQNSKYYNSYVILKKFNELLQKFVPFIKINSAYTNVSEHGKNMYIWDPRGKYRENWTDSEETDINRVTSPVVKILLNYIPRVNKDNKDMINSIGLKTYNTVMSTVLTWIHQNKGHFIDVKEVNDDIRKHGLSADYNKMLDVYVAHVSPNEGVSDVIRGIQKHILNKDTAVMPVALRNSLVNQFFITAKFSYFSYRISDGKIQGQYLEDGFINTQQNQLMRSITSRVRILQEEPKLFERLLDSIGAEVIKRDEDILIKLKKEVFGNEIVITVSKSNDTNTSAGTIEIHSNFEPGTVLNEKAVINLIERVLQKNVPSNYVDIIESMSEDNLVNVSLFNIFENPIAILLAAAKEGNDHYLFDYNNNNELKSYSYKRKCSDAARFISIARGSDELSVFKNGEGNNLPIFQLAPAIFDIFDLIDYYTDAKGDIFLTTERLITDKFQQGLSKNTISNILENNPYVKNPTLLKRIVARSDIKINNRVKSSDKLSVPEVLNAAVFTDFYSNLIYTPTASENDRKTNKELENCILMQPITFSDKKTHFLLAINLAEAELIKYTDLDGSINSKKPIDVFRELVKDSTYSNLRTSYITAIKNQIKKYIGDKSKREMFNQYARFYAVFKKDKNRKYKTTDWDANNSKLNFATFDALSAFKEVNEILQELNKESNPKEAIRKAFSGIATLNEDFDFRYTKQKKLQANETLFFNIQTSVVDNGNFDKFITRSIKNFATGLGEYNISADLIKNPELSTYFNSMVNKTKWIDSISGIMKSFVAKMNGVEVTFSQPEIEAGALFADNVEIELNPIFEAYFYAHNLYAVPGNDLIFGEQANYAPKTLFDLDFNTIDPFDSRIEEIMASSLSMEFKRTTYGGAVKRRFAPGLTFGVPDMIRFAGIDTTKRDISTIRGETHDQKTQDGNGWVDPVLARMIQKSLIESPVGDVRKTIAGWVDPRTNCQVHFKWAEDTITTALRQRNDGTGSLEQMLRKGRRFNIQDKFKAIPNLSKYYSPKDKTIYRVEGEVVTHTDYIYRYDIDNGIYWRLDSIKNNNGQLEMSWTRVDEKGKSLGITDVKSHKIKNLYDFNLAFGGAWVYDLIDGNMVPSEAVHDIEHWMICENGMKNDFVGYFVGREGCKSGAFNWNSYDKLSPSNNEDLDTHYIRSSGIGVLQNSDHELDYSAVTEMTQMMTLLSQNGKNIDIVNQMYEDVGRVANDALDSIITNIDNEKEIYRILGKALMESFNSGNREELGLAQAFIRNAQKTLTENGNINDIILPYSAETIKGAFIASVTSLINKRGIRRKYAGFGGVEVGAEDIVVHWDVDGKYLTYREVRDHYRDLLKKNKITWQQLTSNVTINGKLNPSMRLINQSDVHFGDTVFIRKRNGGGEEVIQIDTQPEFDKVVALLDPNKWEVYLWQAKSKQLGQSDLRINANGKVFSEYSLDSVRASFYLDDLQTYKKTGKGVWNDEFVDRRKNVIRAAITNEDMSVIPDWNIELLWDSNKFDKLIPQLKKLLNRKTTLYMDKLSQIAKSNKAGELPTQMIEVGDQPNIVFLGQNLIDGKMHEITMPLGNSLISPKLEKRVAQIAMGRKNFEKFLLKKGDHLNEIKDRGPQFFYERLVEKANSFNSARRQIKGLRYDALLQLSNGETLIVCVGNPKSEQLYDGQDFISSSDAISYKGKVIVDNKLLKNVGNVTEILTRSYLNPENNTIMPVLIVKDFDVFNKLRRSSAVNQWKYNFNKSNWRQILETSNRSVNADILNEDGETKSNINVNGETHSLVSNDDVEAISFIVRTLNRIEHRFNRDRLWEKARLLHRNFIAQLDYLQTRIPSQAMQSTMSLEVVDIIDIDTNYLWIPLITHLLQGSDLDIDKGYCMGYDVDDNGNIYAESDLIYNPDYSVEDVLMLPSPNDSLLTIGEEEDDNWNISKEEFLRIVKEGEVNNWAVIDYIKAFNALTKPGEDTVIENLGLIRGDFKGEMFYWNHDVTEDVLNLPEQERPNEIFILKPITLELVHRAIDELNIHNASVIDERRSAGALRNKVFVAGRQIMLDPSSQMDHMMPVSLGEARSAAENSSLGKKEKRISIYNPVTIFEMQQQNMTGKTVIPLTATGIKSFFIVSTGYNTKAKQIEKLLDVIDKTNINETGTEIAAILNELTFDSIFDPNNKENTTLRTFANINLDGILERLGKYSYIKDGSLQNIFNNIRLTRSIVPTRANENNWKTYVEGSTFRLYDLLVDLDSTANGNIWSPKTKVVKLPDGTMQEVIDYEYFVVNAADSLGALLNAAADNAKELVLEKLNANDKFADFYVGLLMLGYKFNDIAKEMTGGAIRIVSRYATDNIFDPSTHKFDTRSAIDFVLDLKDLPCIDLGMVDAYITNTVDVNGSYRDNIQQFKGFGLYLLDNDFALDNKQSFLQYLHSLLDFSNLSEAKGKSLDPEDPSEAGQIRTMLKYGSYEWRNTFAKKLLATLRNSELKTVDGKSASNVLMSMLINHIADSIKQVGDSGNIAGYSLAPQSEPEPEPDISDLIDSEEFDLVNTNTIPGRSKFETSFNSKNLKQLYRYIQLYLIPKNQAWMALSPEEQIRGTKILMEMKTKVLHALDEIKMIGAYGSINQGLRVGDYPEYAFVERLNKFINTAYLDRTREEDINAIGPDGKPFEQFEPFDLLVFLDDTQKEYHDRQIAQYDRVKAVVNVLQAIDGIPNFKAMFRYTRLNRNLVSRAFAVKLERKLAQQALLQNNDEKRGINTGLRNSFNQEEFRILQHYTRDLIILNFFMRYGAQLSISIPKDVSYYGLATDGTISHNNKVAIKKGKPIFLNNIVDIANFKRLMDRYIIPRLIEDDRFVDNAFIRSLTQDDDSKDFYTKKAITGYKLNIPLINLESERDITAYSKALYWFNQLMYTPVPSDYNLSTDSTNMSQWTIGNLFFIYNLISYKDRIGGNSMTRLLEDVMSSGNKNSLPGLYYRYINNLDRGLEDIYKPDGSVDNNKFLYDIRDLLYRLASVPTAQSKFGVKLNLIENKVHIPQSDPVVIETDQQVLSDFTFGMPFATKFDNRDTFEPAKNLDGFNRKISYKYNSIDVFDAFVDAIQNTYGKNIPIETVDSEDINNKFSDYSDEEIETLQNSNGFIIDGKIYLNRSKFSLDSPIHEIMHFVAAGMKFNSDPNIRNIYYRLLSNVEARYQNPTDEAEAELFEQLSDKYKNRTASDKAEEFLVTLLARDFQKRFNDIWGQSKIMTKQLLQSEVRKVLSEIFEDDTITSWNQEGIDFENIKLEDITRLFAKHILTMDPKLHSGNIAANQDLAELKKFLADGKYIEFENCL